MPLTKREKTIVFFGSISALLILCYSFIIDPFWQSHKEISEEIEKKSLLISRFTSLKQSEKQVREQFATLSSRVRKQKRGLLASGSPSLAAADLQKFLNETARRTGVRIESEKVLKASPEDIFMVVPVEIIIKSNLRNISKFLFHLENGNKLLTIQFLAMKNTRRDPAPTEELIESKIVASGYYINGKNS